MLSQVAISSAKVSNMTIKTTMHKNAIKSNITPFTNSGCSNTDSRQRKVY